jgi:hypothetical protein
MSKHTPGPWEVFEDDYSIGVETPIGILFSDFDNTENDEADARLIAAAPEMLEALKAVIVAIKIEHVLAASQAWRDLTIGLTKIVRKAEGE